MAYFLPSLVCFIDNALKRLSEWHVEYDLGMDVRVAQIAKTRKRAVSKADVRLWISRKDRVLKLLKIPGAPLLVIVEVNILEKDVQKNL
jgi:hypothetical protein